MMIIHNLFPVFMMIMVLSLLLLKGVNAEIFLSFPLQFSANITITAFTIKPDSEYPPRVRSLTVYFDYIAKKVRADMNAGYEAAKTYLRRYDKKMEYMIRYPPIDDCKRSYLGEVMPYPDIDGAIYIKSDEIMNGIKCNYFRIDEIGNRLHIYMSQLDNSPVKLLQESYDDKQFIEMLAYEYSNVYLQPPDSSIFELSSISYGTTFTYDQCTKHTGGFPYLHIFHHYVRF